jgi:hypothetical protein
MLMLSETIHLVRLLLSARLISRGTMFFSHNKLKQPQPAYKPQKQPAEQGDQFLFLSTSVLISDTLCCAYLGCNCPVYIASLFIEFYVDVPNPFQF